MKQGYTKVSIRTVDTVVVVIAVAAAERLSIYQLWVAFGTGKSFRFLAAHEMVQALGPDKCRGLPAFHAFTGCDTVSSFGGRSKKTAWETWKVCDEVTATFCALGATPTLSIVDDSLDTLERFVVLLYYRTSPSSQALPLPLYDGRRRFWRCPARPRQMKTTSSTGCSKRGLHEPV